VIATLENLFTVLSLVINETVIGEGPPFGEGVSHRLVIEIIIHAVELYRIVFWSAGDAELLLL
jgi:hypothetical protein